jgi:hypothetical protein
VIIIKDILVKLQGEEEKMSECIFNR